MTRESLSYFGIANDASRSEVAAVVPYATDSTKPPKSVPLQEDTSDAITTRRRYVFGLRDTCGLQGELCALCYSRRKQCTTDC